MNPSENTSPKVLIIGSGVCGLYAGLTLTRAGAEVTILEKEPRIGGLAAGFKFGENFCDFGVHMLHAFNQEIFEDCATLMGDERIEVALDARIRWGGSSCRYPLKFKDMLCAMPPFTLFRCVSGLMIAELTGAKKRKDINNAEDALIAFYGAPLYEYFFEEFTHKYWNIHPRNLSAEFIRRKMPRLSAVDVLRKLLPSIPFRKKHQEEVTESALDTETLHYSRTGSESLPRSLANEFTRLGGTIHTETTISNISLNPCQVNYCHKSKEIQWTGDYVINTAPLHSLLHLLGNNAPERIHSSVSKLKYKPTVVYALLIKKERCMNGLYIYYRSRTFHRVGEPKNAGLIVRPDGHTILIVESTCETNDFKWQGSDAYKEEIIRDLEDESICQQQDIIEWNLMRSPHGYPIYTNGFDVHLTEIQTWIEQQQSLRSTGRQGAFCYPAMHSAMQLGKNTAQEIIYHHAS